MQYFRLITNFFTLTLAYFRYIMSTNTTVPSSPRYRTIQEGENPAVRILAIGASLIEGYMRVDNVVSFAPFTDRLAELIKRDYPSLEFIVDNQGKAGQRTEHIVERGRMILQKNSYTHVIILAGNNDVFTLEQDLRQSINNLKQLYDMFNDTAVKRWVLTLPCHHLEEEYLPYKERRIIYNAELKKVIPAHDVLHFDAWNDTQVQNKALYMDAIHYSPLGYKAFGEYIYESIKGHLDSAVQSRL